MSVSRPVQVLQRMVASVSIVALLSSSLPAQTGQRSADVRSRMRRFRRPLRTNPQGQTEYAAPLQQYAQPHSVWAVGSRMRRTGFRNRC